MANEEQLAILRQGVDAWNQWRDENPDTKIDLSEADLGEAKLPGINLNQARLRRVNFYKADLSGGDLSRTNLRKANLFQASLIGSDLSKASLKQANLGGANLNKANLVEANLSDAELRGANLGNANLGRASLYKARIGAASLRGTNLSQANLTYANLNQADLNGADLSRANLTQATLISTKVTAAKVSGSEVYGINVWDLVGEFEEQEDLIITHKDEPLVTVDNIKVAQFIHLILNNEEIRNVINSFTSKSVLILGRFSIPERKAILDALRIKLREYDLVPIVFDFDRPTDKDFTETIKTLAGLSYFVIADVTNPKSSPLELQATVPDYQIPFVPIIQEGEQPFAMMANLQTKYNWVLPTKSYDSIDTLMLALKPAIIDPAVEMRNKLRLIKAREQKTESLRDYLEKSL
jgi:uncharacterized protein YjbI with pentapeptide repeats